MVIECSTKVLRQIGKCYQIKSADKQNDASKLNEDNVVHS